MLTWGLHGIVHDFFSHFKKVFDSLPLFCPSRQVDCGAYNKVNIQRSWSINRCLQKLGCCLERQKTPPSGVELICMQWQAMAYNEIGIIYEKPG